MINLWDKLPTELTYEIMEYNKLPYLDELRTKIPTIAERWATRAIANMSEWIDHKRHRRDHRNLYGDVFYVYKGRAFYPCREDVIKMMKINKLRIRRGMKTRTMIHHLIKV